MKFYGLMPRTAILLIAGMATMTSAKGGGPPRMAVSIDGHTVVATNRWAILLYNISETVQLIHEIPVMHDLSPIAILGARDLLVTGGINYAARKPQNQVLMFADLSEPTADTLVSLDVSITDLQFNPDESQLVIASADGVARVWDLSRRAVVFEIQHGDQGLTAVRYSHDGSILATAGDNRVRLWSADNGKPLATLVSSKEVNAIAFDPSDLRLLVGNMSQSLAVLLMDIGTGEVLASFDHTVAPSQAGLNDPLATAVAFGPDGHFFGSAALDGTVRVWDATSFELAGKREFNPGIYSLEFIDGGETLLSYGTSSDGPALNIWRFGPTTTSVTPSSWAAVKTP